MAWSYPYLLLALYSEIPEEGLPVIVIAVVIGVLDEHPEVSKCL